jgi:hypothetical protein
MLNSLLFTTEPETFATRGRALECLGHIAVAIGPTHFVRYFPIGMQACQEGIALNDEGLKEYSYVFIANAAKVMTHDFDSHLPQLVPYLLTVIGESELQAAMHKEGSDDDDDDEEYHPDGGSDDEGDSDSGEYNQHVTEGFINTKKAALTALGALAEHCTYAFYPFMEQAMHVVLNPESGAVTSYHDYIRGEAYSILQFFVVSACHAHRVTALPSKGEILPLPAEVSRLCQIIMREYVSIIAKDFEKSVVANALEGLSAILQRIGIAALQLPVGDKGEIALVELIGAMLTCLQEKAVCQMRVESTEEDDDDNHDNLVMDGVSDLAGQLAKTMGPAFIPYFDEFHKYLIRFTKPTRLHSDRSMAMGCYAEVMAEIGPDAIKYAEVLLPIVKAMLVDSMEGVRRNAAFCVGVLVQSTGSALSSQVMNILQWLYPVCVRPDAKRGKDAGGADIDNALASVARIIKTLPTVVPINYVLPVVINSLPLIGDPSEGPGIYECIATLLLNNEPTAVGLFTSIVPVFGECFATEASATDETKVVVAASFKRLAALPQYRDTIMSYIAHLATTSPDQKAALELAISTAAN